jgi:hypothetical protein
MMSGEGAARWGMAFAWSARGRHGGPKASLCPCWVRTRGMAVANGPKGNSNFKRTLPCHASVHRVDPAPQCSAGSSSRLRPIPSRLSQAGCQLRVLAAGGRWWPQGLLGHVTGAC